MNYGKIEPMSIVDGEGIRVTLFVSGCRNHCKGCFNEETWDFGYGNPFTEIEEFPADCVDEAIDQTDDDTHQAMEALVQNLNSLQSRSGNQVPFSSLNFGLDVSACGRMASQNLIRAQYEGMGDGLTAIFPILIFKMMEGYTVNDDDPNVDLFDESIKCLARRFYPNFVSEDNE